MNQICSGYLSICSLLYLKIALKVKLTSSRWPGRIPGTSSLILVTKPIYIMNETVQ